VPPSQPPNSKEPKRGALSLPAFRGLFSYNMERGKSVIATAANDNLSSSSFFFCLLSDQFLRLQEPESYSLKAPKIFSDEALVLVTFQEGCPNHFLSRAPRLRSFLVCLLRHYSEGFRVRYFSPDPPPFKDSGAGAFLRRLVSFFSPLSFRCTPREGDTKT